jgi:holo-ACP synthase/triphosphoribosyl-dephospho-CoA synthase
VTANRFFSYCLHDLKLALKANRIDLAEKDAIAGCDAAGDYYFVPVLTGGLSLQTIKYYCEDFEQNHLLGRFIDADLNDQDGNTISSGKAKLCFFCLERAAIECRRENAHEPEELRAFMFPRMDAYCRQQREGALIKKLSSLAQQALLTEISLTPKPGLVDKFSNGSHTDMNYQRFMNSTAAISPWFGHLVREGFAFRDQDLTRGLSIIRTIGLRMESAMYTATNNVNTQKGIIFLLGISLFACGVVYERHDQFDSNEFRTVVAGICKGIVNRELDGFAGMNPSHGEVIFHKYGHPGARGEAEGGFQSVFEYGLPQLAGIIDLNKEALIKCFLAIASANEDTNILFRSDAVVLNSFKQLCKYALDNFTEGNYARVIEYCKINNISPGGSADLLAVTIFVWLVLKNDRLE